MRQIEQWLRYSVLPIALLATSACSDFNKPQTPRQKIAAERASRELAESQAKKVLARIQANADPYLDAKQAIARKDFRLLNMVGIGGAGRPSGVTCFTPGSQAPRVLAGYFYGDVIDEKAAKFEQYAVVYNRLLVESPTYADADICRLADAAADKGLDRIMPLRMPARAITRPPQSLHEAARRGMPADLRRFMGADLDAVDGTGMTPLAWAVARNNSQAITILTNAGADPWIGDGYQTSAAYLSAILGEVDQFERLAEIGERPFQSWPAIYLAAAAKGASPILDRMLAEPHEQFRIDLLTFSLPSPTVLEKILIDDRTLADSLLVEATQAYNAQPLRPDLVALALRFGANPNAEAHSSRTVLGEIANGLDPASPQVVDLLLKAGADPNKLSWIDRPVWQPLRTIRLLADQPELNKRALAIYRRLRRAGADLNLPNGDGIPPIRTFLFPSRYEHVELDEGAGKPAVLEMLVRDGVDLNSKWRGHSVLSLVEKQNGKNSELALTLRRLGAKP
jgi:hypothetical protein